MSELQAVLWDMDGTLIDSEKLWAVALAEAMERLGGALTDDLRATLNGSSMGRSTLLMFAAVGREPEPSALAELAAWLNARMTVLFRAGLPWQPGAEEALRAVRRAGFPTALVTSTQRPLTEIALDSIGREFFDVTVCGDEVDGLNKPHPRPFLLAAELLGVDPVSCVAVEDSVAGADAAAAAGCAALVVPSEAPVPSGPRRVLRDSLVGVDAEVLAAILAGTRGPRPDGPTGDGTLDR